MTIFALDSAGKTAGVCVFTDGKIVYESYLATGLTHSETLLALCDAAFKAAKLDISDVALFAACAGPGSFTGLRIGLAALKGLAFAHDTPCASVSTLEALAHSVPFDCTLGTALDARRGEVYCAAFRIKNGEVTRFLDDTAMSAANFAEKLCEFGENPICMGDGAHLVCQKSENVRLMPAEYRFGRANGICRAAEKMYKDGLCTSADELIPDYHRLSQAERDRAEKMKNEVCK